MSRIGKEPVKLTEGVTATVEGQKVTVKGKLGELSYTMHEGISAKVEDGAVRVSCDDDDAHGNFHGLARALINNMVIGVSKGYTKQLSIEGTGFKAVLKGQELALSLGFASPKIFVVPAEIYDSAKVLVYAEPDRKRDRTFTVRITQASSSLCSASDTIR